MKQNLFISLSAACLLAACTSNDELQTSEQPEAIDATATLADATDMPVSRTVVNGLPASGTLAVAFARLDEEGADTYPTAGYTGVTAASPATIDNAGKVTFTPALYYLTNKDIDETKLVGWYPAGTYNAGTVTFSIDGSMDVLLSNEKAGSLTSKFGTSDFTFDHQLSQIVVKAYAADAVSAGADGKWGKIKMIYVLNQPNECKITLPGTATGSVTTTGSSMDYIMRAIGADVDMREVTLQQKASAADAVECGYSIIAPTTSNTFNLKVHTSTGIEQTIPVTLKQESDRFLKGKKYTVVLKFSVAGIEPAGTAITPWSTDGVVNPDEIMM